MSWFIPTELPLPGRVDVRKEKLASFLVKGVLIAVRAMLLDLKTIRIVTTILA